MGKFGNREVFRPKERLRTLQILKLQEQLRRLLNIAAHVLGPVLVLIGCAASAHAEDEDAAGFALDGVPYYSIYAFEQVGAGTQTPRLSEDPYGRLLVLDEISILPFDGHSWRAKFEHGLGKNPDSPIIARTGPDGKLYVGCIGKWGELKVLPDGDYEVSRFENSDPNWGKHIRFIEVLFQDTSTYFIGDFGVVRRNSEGEERYWDDLRYINTGFVSGGDVYLAGADTGLLRLVNDEWEVLKGTEKLKSSNQVLCATQLSAETMLLGTQSGELYRLENGQLERWQTVADSMFAKGISALAHLGDGYVAVAASTYGILALDPKGEVVMQITTRQDPNFGSVFELFQQERGILWATLPNGLAKIYFPSHVTQYDYRFGMSLEWPKVHRYDDGLLFHTVGRVYEGRRDEIDRLRNFDLLEIEGVEYIHTIGVSGNQLLINANGKITCRQADGTSYRVTDSDGGWRMVSPKTGDDSIIILGQFENVLLKKKSGRFRELDRQSAAGAPSVVLEASDGSIWIEHGIGRISRLTIMEDAMHSQVFEGIEGIEDRWWSLSEFEGSVYLSTDELTWKFDETLGQFTKTKELDALLRGRKGIAVTRPVKSSNGFVYAPTSKGMLLAKVNERGEYDFDHEVLRQVVAPYPIVHEDDDGYGWFSTQRAIYRFNPNLPSPDYRELKPVITEIEVLKKGGLPNHVLTYAPEQLGELAYSQNNLRIRFYPNTYSLPAPPQYRYRIAGFSPEWSAPFTEPAISLTNLPEGDYRLEIDVLDRGISNGATTILPIRILPPWYRTWKSYFGGVIFTGFLLALIIKLAQRRADHDRQRLAALVASRTHELDETNHKLREALASATTAAEVKSRFLANMSHEIRTPMNGVVATTELLAQTPLSPDQRELVEIVNKSGNLLLTIVNDVLDYSKIEADQIVFEAIPFRPIDLIEDVLDILAEKSNEKGVELFGSVDSSVPEELVGDTTRIQQILVNLVSNALKFTAEGEVEMRVSARTNGSDQADVVFAVRDTGIGIAPERIDRLFSAFTQLDASNTRIYGGSGLGLAITKRLIERMGGTITVNSVEGRGSTFFATIPLAIGRRFEATSMKSPARKVLLIDDCKNRSVAFCSTLEGCGYTAQACTLKQGPQAVTGAGADVIILDCGHGDDWRKTADAVAAMQSARPLLLVMRLPLQTVTHPAISKTQTKPWRCRRLLSDLEEMFDKPFKEESATIGSFEYIEGTMLSKLNVLLAEDNPVNQRVAVLLLRKMGVTPQFAANGREAVEMTLKGNFDVVLMDVQMPEMDGIEATQTIRSAMPREKQPLIIALTAGAMSSDREAAFEAGVDAYLTKPLRFDPLKDQLEAAAANRAERSTAWSEKRRSVQARADESTTF